MSPGCTTKPGALRSARAVWKASIPFAIADTGVAGLPPGLGRPVPGLEFGEESVEHVRGKSGELPERARTPAEAVGVAHPDIVARKPLSCSDSTS